MPAAGLVAALLFSTLTVPGFDRVLLPMHNGNARGAGGSEWRVDEVILNQSDQPATFYPHFFMSQWFEATVSTVPPRRKVPPSEIDQPRPCRNVCAPPAHPGGILYIKSEDRSRFVIYDRVYEETFDHDNRGAVVPAIHESDFRRGRTTFASVPIGSNFRSMLRLYNLDTSSVALGIRLVRPTASGDVTIATARIVVPPAYAEIVSGPYPVPLRPGYQQITLESLLTTTEGEPVDVMIDPEEASREYWGFLSVTSHSAQRVTVFVPSP